MCFARAPISARSGAISVASIFIPASFSKVPLTVTSPWYPPIEMSLPLPTTLSPSKISAFKHCPLQFRFSVIDRLPEPPSPAASKGTLVHRALELLMLRPPAERTQAAALAGLEQAQAELADHPEFAGLELDAEALDAFHADARALVRRYFEIEDPAE